jgi:hypothetical protein
MSPSGTQTVILQRLEAELDKLWSFVGVKANRYWVWIAMDASLRQLIAFHVGDRSGQSAQSEQGRERLVNLCQFRITKRKYAKEEKSAVRFYRNFPLAGLWMVKLDSLPGKLQFVNVQHTRSPLRMFSLSTLPPSARHFAECQGVK